MGHPVLMRVADPVADPKAPEIRRLIADMVDTMADAPGIGLAAPQVHVPSRLVIFHIPESRAGDAVESRSDDQGGPAPDDVEAVPMTVLINPVIEPLGEEKELGAEGCLSLPGMLGLVPRFTRIRYRAVGPDGNLIEREAADYHARVVQHECDHLDGILYPMRMDDLASFGFADEMGRDALPLGDRLRQRERMDDV